MPTSRKHWVLDDGLTNDQAQNATKAMISKLLVPVVIAAMPIQDVIELASFMVETTIKFVRFNLRAETVGGPIEIAVITKHEGFKWIRRKPFYTGDWGDPSMNTPGSPTRNIVSHLHSPSASSTPDFRFFDYVYPRQNLLGADLQQYMQGSTEPERLASVGSLAVLRQLSSVPR